MTILVTGQLPIGFDFNGQRVTKFAARPAIVKDSIESIEELGADCSKARLRVAIESRQVKFDDVPDEAHSIDLLLNLSDPDYNALAGAIDEAEKKLMALSKP